MFMVAYKLNIQSLLAILCHIWAQNLAKGNCCVFVICHNVIARRPQRLSFQRARRPGEADIFPVNSSWSAATSGQEAVHRASPFSLPFGRTTMKSRNYSFGKLATTTLDARPNNLIRPQYLVARQSNHCIKFRLPLFAVSDPFHAR